MPTKHLHRSPGPFRSRPYVDRVIAPRLTRRAIRFEAEISSPRATLATAALVAAPQGTKGACPTSGVAGEEDPEHAERTHEATRTPQSHSAKEGWGT
jgi:hypothetical protein